MRTHMADICFVFLTMLVYTVDTSRNDAKTVHRCLKRLQVFKPHSTLEYYRQTFYPYYFQGSDFVHTDFH